MPIADAKSENDPTPQKSTPNQVPTISCRRRPSIWRNATVCGNPGVPKSVECDSIEVKQIVATVTSTNVTNCSTLANLHQRRQRAMLAGVGSKMKAEAAGAACASPVTVLTRRGTYCPIPKPLSRIQLL